MNEELSIIANFLITGAALTFFAASIISAKKSEELRRQMNGVKKSFMAGWIRHTEFMRLKTDIMNRRDELQVTGMISFLAASVCALLAIIL